MVYINRRITEKILDVIKRKKSILLLGPRQTGKTTLMRHIQSDAYFSLADVRLRLRYEKNPGLLANEIEAIADSKNQPPLIIIDEIQKVPLLMDVAQDLIDRKIAQFILTGSSARKLRKGGNLLPGRIITFYIDPLSMDEIPESHLTIQDRLLFGSLPEIILTTDKFEKEQLLESYITTYLEEEIRAEALVRNLGSFARFLELSAGESGYPVNFSKLSQEIGVTHKTIVSYYEILLDCLVVERVEPITQSKLRRKLIKSQKYLFFDLGVRRLAAREGIKLPGSYFGHLFEQFIGLELIRIKKNEIQHAEIRYWRDPDGPEVDWVVDLHGQYIPIEVKWTDKPSLKDAKHLFTFLAEYPEGKKGYIICTTPFKMKLAENIEAIPWQEIHSIFDRIR